MGKRRYTVLGWLTWKMGSRAARRKLEQNRTKLKAAGAVLLVVVAGILAGRSGDDD
jgi:hypothetical protein